MSDDCKEGKDDNGEFYLPEKYRNKLYKFKAGGYEGCIWCPAVAIVDGKGGVALVNGDIGAGGLGAEEWYARKMREYLDGVGAARVEDLLLADQKDPTLGKYKAFVEYSRRTAEERDNITRVRVFEALEDELGKSGSHGWDHEFEELDISTPDLVREACVAIKPWGDAYLSANVADALAAAGYKGAGFVCSVCGKYTDYTGNENLLCCDNPDSYSGIGGLAVAHDSILCDDCAAETTCPVCGKRGALSDDYGNLPYPNRFMHRWITACDGCVDSFLDDNEKFLDDLVELGESVKRDKELLAKYLDAMRPTCTEERVGELEEANLRHMRECWMSAVNKMRKKMREAVKLRFEDDYNADSDVGPDEECDY